jgi:hypothetical protein
MIELLFDGHPINYAVLICITDAKPPVLHEVLYQLSKPLIGFDGSSHNFVVVRSVTQPIKRAYIYGADRDGNIVSPIELPGSVEQTDNQVHALDLAGYPFVLTDHLDEEESA